MLKTRWGGFLLALSMAAALVNGTGVVCAGNYAVSGLGNNCGATGNEANVTWELDNGTLTISGTGEMADYTSYVDATPWASDKASIQKVVIGENVTKVGIGAFRNCTKLESVTFQGATPPRIGSGAFDKSDSDVPGKIYYPESSTSYNETWRKNTADDIAKSNNLASTKWTFGYPLILSVTSNDLDFGSVTVNETKVLTIGMGVKQAYGTISVSFNVTGDSVDSFSVTGGSESSLWGNQAWFPKVWDTTFDDTTLEVTFKPTQVKDSYNATLKITSTGAETVTVSLTGKGIAAGSSITGGQTGGATGGGNGNGSASGGGSTSGGGTTGGGSNNGGSSSDSGSGSNNQETPAAKPEIKPTDQTGTTPPVAAAAQETPAAKPLVKTQTKPEKPAKTQEAQTAAEPESAEKAEENKQPVTTPEPQTVTESETQTITEAKTLVSALPVNPNAEPIPNAGYEYPAYRNETPDPNDPASPEVIVVLDDEDIAAAYRKTIDPEDEKNKIYMEDDSIPLAAPKKTEEPGSLLFINWIIILFVVFVGLFILFIIFMKKRKKDEEEEAGKNGENGTHS